MSGLVQVAGPAAEPLTAAEAKAWLRIDSTDEDTLISDLIVAARVHAENFLNRALISQTFQYKLDQWPGGTRIVDGKISEARGGFACGREILLPRPPLISVQSVTYYDTAGALQTFSSSSYHVDTAAHPGRILLDDDADWPEVDERPNAVIIAYTAGYANAAAVPAPIRTAVRMLVSHWFDTARNGHVNVGNLVSEIPDTVQNMLWLYRIPELA